MSLLKRILQEQEASHVPPAPGEKLTGLLATIERINHIQDLDTLLEHVLQEARRFASADAGTIYTRGGDKLYFSYVQNDTLFKDPASDKKFIYANESIDIDKNSLAGYVASTGESLLIDNVYHIKNPVSYQHNPNYDQRSSYKTASLLVVPITTNDNQVLGVLQLINKMDAKGRVVAFSNEDRLYVGQFAQNAASAIEKAKLSREMVLRMVEMAELRDPFETSDHARRVGDYAVELYEAWTRRHNLWTPEIVRKKDVFRTAAILHDVGKVAISDTILKKQRNLTARERLIMKAHTIYGARLFKYNTSAWDKMAAEVALNHHERWDGKGYPGKLVNIDSSVIRFGPGKAGKEIPLSARIVTLSDVYDALISKRSYKQAWKEDRALTYIKKQAGFQFDPEFVDIFIQLYDLIRVIRRRYPS